MGITVPLSWDKPAWGPLAGIVLAASGMLATDWDVVANTMSDLTEPEVEALFTSLIPFILQSHGRLLIFATRETMMPPTAVFATYLQAAVRIAAPGMTRQHGRRAPRVCHDSGAGYSEAESIIVRPTSSHVGGVTFWWQASSVVESVRFDPVAVVGVTCPGVTATVHGAAVDIVRGNCHRFGTGLDVFMTIDPIYDLRGVTPDATGWLPWMPSTT